MAQHIPVKDDKVLRSVARIARHVYPDAKRGRCMDWAYFRKDVRHLPAEFNPDGYAFLVSPYDMRKVFPDEPYAEERATLEAHINKDGILTGVYYPL